MVNFSRNLEASIVDGHFNDGKSTILGLEYVSSSYTWRRMDAESTVITMTSSDIDSHPIFRVDCYTFNNSQDCISLKNYISTVCANNNSGYLEVHVE